MSKYDKRNIDNRLNTKKKHNNRAMYEMSKTISGFKFIEKIEVFYYSGKDDVPKDEFAIQFYLKYPILPIHFVTFLEEKLRGAIIGK